MYKLLNKPKFLTPSTNMQERSIDVGAKSLPFSCIIDGNEAITAWQIIIYYLNDDSVAFDTGKQTLDPYFYPIDEKNRNVVFSKDLKPYTENNTKFLNSQTYYWTITFWGDLGSSVTSCEEVFYANVVPSVSIKYSLDGSNYSYLSSDVILNSKQCYFKGEYIQNEGILLKRYGWRLTDITTGQVLSDTITKNQIYGMSGNIAFSYNGFLNDSTYSIELYLETQNNVEVVTEPIVFSVVYKTTYLSNDFKVESLKREPSVILDWSKSVVIGGKEVGKKVTYKENYPVVNNSSVSISKGGSIVYDYGSNSNLDISEDCYVVLSMQLLNNQDTLLFVAEGVDENGYEIIRKLSFTSGSFVYSVLGNEGNLITQTYTPSCQPNEYVWYVITMSPLLQNDGGEYYVDLIVSESQAVNGLYPSDNLYPRAEDDENPLYPSFGVWETVKEGV